MSHTYGLRLASAAVLVTLAMALPMAAVHAEQPPKPVQPPQTSGMQPTPGVQPGTDEGAPDSPYADRIEAVIAAARAYLGTPYRVGTEGPDTVDCSGLVFRAFANAGEAGQIGGSRLRAAGYLRWFAAHNLLTTDPAEAERGDLVIYGNGEHIGIYLGDGRVISAVVSGVTVHSLNGISIAPTGFLAVDWSGKRGPFKPGNLVLPTILDEPEAPASLVPAVAWIPEAPAADIAAGPAIDGVERTDMRTANSRTFENDNGGFTTEVFTRPINYLPAGSTEWQPIDLSFHAPAEGADADAAQTPPVAVADTAPATLSLNAAANGGQLLTLASGALSLSFTPADAKDGSTPELGEEGRYADYRDLLAGGVGLRVFPRADGLKSFLVLAHEPDANRLAINIDAPGLNFTLELDGSVTLRDAADAVVGRIPRPMLLDSSDTAGDGGGVRSGAVSLRLETTELGHARLVAAINRASLDEAVYPAYVDLGVVDFPTAGSGALHTFVSSARPFANFSAYQRPETPGYAELWHGRRPDMRDDNEAYLRFAGVPELLSGVTVQSASLAAFPYWQADHSAAASTWIGRVTADWDLRTLNWETRPTSELAPTTAETTQGQWSAMDVGDYLRGVASGASVDYGLVLHADDAGRGYWKRFVAESSAGTGALEPRLVINWTGLRPLAAASANTAASSVVLGWSNATLAPAATRYHVQVSRDGFETMLLNERIKGTAVADNSLTVARSDLGLRSVEWRVRAKYGESTEWSAWSDPRTVTVVNPAENRFHQPIGGLTGGV
jgi:cell wall-associated NlpC family hydrolase